MARFPRARQALTWSARIAVTVTFVLAALPKLADPAQFAVDISNFQVFPYWSWNLLAGTVPMLELTGATLLWHPATRRIALLVLGTLTVAFALLLSSVLIRGIDVSCGCFGGDPQGEPANWWDLARDLALLGVLWLGAGRDLLRPAGELGPAR